jgi:dolichyl-phosphate beta-glucosyltransferase
MLVIVVPCFNEATRFDAHRFGQLLSLIPEASLKFVDDGSTDSTRAILTAFSVAHPDRVSILSYAANAGKGEAIRRGLLAAITESPSWTGYFDADLATPPEEVQKLWITARSNESLDLVFGSRIRLCGSHIARLERRHLAGRLFAHLAARVLETHVYDTQAGAKFLRNTPALSQVLNVPFCDRWSFDVEILGRLGRLGLFPDRALEVPLRAWHDVPASKVSLRQGLAAVLSLWRVRSSLRKFHA